VVGSESRAARISSSSAVLDRAFGRAPQSIELRTELSFGAQSEVFIQTLHAGTLTGNLTTEGVARIAEVGVAGAGVRCGLSSLKNLEHCAIMALSCVLQWRYSCAIG
jgi:hypothetical protein